VEIEGMPCAYQIEAGAKAPGPVFVIGYVSEGVTAPNHGFGCFETGCDEFHPGETSPGDGLFVTQFEAGDSMPSGSGGILGCQRPPNEDCYAVDPETWTATGDGVVTAFLGGNNPPFTTTVEGLFFDVSGGDIEMQEFDEGQPVEANEMGMAIMGVDPGDSMPNIPVEKAIFCPVGSSEDNGRRKLSLAKFKLTLDNMKKGHF